MTPGTADRDEPAPEAQLRTFLDRFEPEVRKLARAVRAALRKRFPTANELAYGYADSVVVGYSPTERGIEAAVSFAARADGVRLYFMHGPRLPDPKKMLRGSGKDVRFIVLESARQLTEPDVEALIAAAIDRAKVPFPAAGKGRLVIRSAAKKRR